MIEFISGIFVGSVFWPIALGIVWCIALMVCAENERGFLGLASTALFLWLIYLLTNFNILGYVRDNPLTVLMYVGIYLVIGMVYSIVRWDRFVANWRAEFDSLSSTRDKDYAIGRRPTASNSKSRITHWMAYWPWSGLWWLLSDFLTELFSFLYRRLGKVYEYIEKRHAPDYTPTPESEPTRHYGGRQEI
jgi:hypothetical protein